MLLTIVVVYCVVRRSVVDHRIDCVFLRFWWNSIEDREDGWNERIGRNTKNMEIWKKNISEFDKRNVNHNKLNSEGDKRKYRVK